MRIANSLTGLTEYDNIKIESSVCKIGVDVYIGSAADFENVYVSMDLTSRKGGTKPLLYPTKLKRLLEMSSRAEGAYWLDLTTGYVKGTFDIGVAGAYRLEDSEYLKIKITGATTGQVYSLDVIDHPIDVDFVYQFDPKGIQSANANKFNLKGVKAIVMPVANVSAITLDFNPKASGLPQKSVRYTAKEIQAINRDMNDIVVAGKNSDGTARITYGFDELYVLDVNEVDTLTYEAVSNADHEIIFIREIDPTKVTN